MDNFFLSHLDLEPLYESITNNPDLDNLYFTNPEKTEVITEKEESTVEKLLDSFEAESEKTISLKLKLMKMLKNSKKSMNKYDILYAADDYINKYFYKLKLMSEKEFNEFNSLLS